MHDPYESRFIKKLRGDIIAELQRAHEELGKGTQIVSGDAAATGMNCVRYMGRIQAFNDVLKLIEQIENEMSGRAKRD